MLRDSATVKERPAKVPEGPELSYCMSNRPEALCYSQGFQGQGGSAGRQRTC
jgi:hypothetical protein